MEWLEAEYATTEATSAAINANPQPA